MIEMTIDLSVFCNTEDPRYFCTRHFGFGGDSYATNGHMIVRLFDSECEPLDKFPDGLLRAIDLIVADVSAVFIPLVFDSSLAVKTQCQDCAGTGKKFDKKKIKCDECDGGKFRHGAYKYECWDCDGTGLIDGNDDDPATETVCEVCCGTGVARSLIKIDARYFDDKYLDKLMTLPNIKYVSEQDNINKMEAMKFRFTGGAGILMPCRI
jgi:hypothetical protein